MRQVRLQGILVGHRESLEAMNRAIEAHGIPFKLTLPSRRFHRHIGIYADVSADSSGNLLTKEEWNQKRDAWLPGDADKAFVRSLMTKPIWDPKQMANWISPPLGV